MTDSSTDRQGADGADGPVTGGSPPTSPMELFDLRVTVDSIGGRSVCKLAVGDYFEVVNSAELRIPDGQQFCIYALHSVLPFLAAKQRQLPAGDWLESDTLFACPDPEEQLVMRVERIRRVRLDAAELT